MIVETKNLSLEETAALFDGTDVTEGVHRNDVRHDEKDFDEKGSDSAYNATDIKA